MLMSCILLIGMLIKVCVLTTFMASLRTSLNYMITTSSLMFCRSTALLSSGCYC